MWVGSVLSGAKPAEKKRFINELQKDQNIVAMVGDGINDAAALASSHIGVAMGGCVGAASEVSSVVLMGNKLSQGRFFGSFCCQGVGDDKIFAREDVWWTELLDALELSRLTMKTVKQNLWLGIPIAAGMLLPVTGTILTPSIAGALMGLSSIGVMANSLLLRFRFSSKQKQISGAAPHIKINVDYDQLLDSKEKMKYPISDGKWRETR
ncbi:hypothetical protein Patl1_37029 [Pistacia atlantica]|nr:hypothetical protein Patl1_37029 [Pistacia atlantica]